MTATLRLTRKWWPMYLAASIKPDLWISLRRK
jgi:hypothetical protein